MDAQEVPVQLIDIKYNNEILHCKLDAYSDADHEVTYFMTKHNMPEKFRTLLQNKFQTVIDSMKTDLYYGSREQYQTVAQQGIDSTLANESLQPISSNLRERSIFEKLYNYTKTPAKQPEPSRTAYVTTREKYDRVLQRLYDESKYKNKTISVGSNGGNTISYYEQSKLFDRLYKQQLRTLQPADPRQNNLTYEERIIRDFQDAPEVTERVEMNQISKDLTENYSFYDQLQRKSNQYTNNHIKDILNTTNSLQVVKNLTRNMSSADRLFYLEYFKKRYAEREGQSQDRPPQTTVKYLTRSVNKQGREIYQYKEFQVDFRPHINERSKGMHQSIRKDIQYDTAVKRQNKIKRDLRQEETFKPKLISRYVDYQKSILDALFQ